MKSWLQDNNREMYSAHNKAKSVDAERISISKNIYIDKLDDVVKK